MQHTESGQGTIHLAEVRQARTWSHVAKLAAEAVQALDDRKFKDARDLLTAIRGIALNADKEGL